MARTLAIGDIHGCLTALDTLLGFVVPSSDDRLIFLGDYVDRGPDSKGVIGRLIALKRDRGAVCLRGNHEIMMTGARGGHSDFKFWTTFGGIEALDSYATDEEVSIKSIPQSHWRFLEECIDWHETDTHIFVHANLHPDLPLEKQPSEWLHWQAISDKWHKPHVSGKTMICGHTQQRDGTPLRLMKAICIDTCAYGDGWLTCLDVDTGQYWQATDFGRTREGWL
jgi:serine/threonine protein phosphatase 1